MNAPILFFQTHHPRKPRPRCENCARFKPIQLLVRYRRNDHPDHPKNTTDVQLNSLHPKPSGFLPALDNFGDYPVSLGESRAEGVEVESAKVLRTLD